MEISLQSTKGHMGHLPKLIEDLALILIAGAITTLVFRRIKQPLVLGYIIAGFIVGPYLSITPTVADTENVETLAEIGVIFLLFTLGLEFSFRKLVRVGGAASVTALVEIVFITVSGFLLGKWMGWSVMDSLFLGGMLASSSTTIIIRAFDELGVKTKKYASIVFGVLVVEDIVVIVLMVLLSTVAVTQQFEGSEMLFTVSKLLFFLILWFIAGIFLIPTVLKRAKNLLDDENLLILSLALCLGMVVVAVQIGFSAELGAFIMGSILAETTSAEKIEHLTKPVKDLFGAIFFVSVGMMINPEAIIEYRWPVLWITLLTLFGKLGSTTVGALLSGQPLKQSIQVGMSMAQIGEFAFIVATLGLSLGVISDFLFPIAVGASAITTFTTPYMIKFSEPLYSSISKILPERWLKSLSFYSANAQTVQADSNWKHLSRAYGQILLTNGIMLLALFLFTSRILMPFFNAIIGIDLITPIIGLVVSMSMAAPFLWALMARRPYNEESKELWLDRNYSKGPLLVIEILRIITGLIVIGFWVDSLFPTLETLIAVPISTSVFYLFSRSIQGLYLKMEGIFLKNLYAREAAEVILKAKLAPKSQLSPWDAHIVDLEVKPEAEYIGKTLFELGWREKYGINIAYIKRGEKLIYTPGRNHKLLPFDKVGILATDEQIKIFKPMFDRVEIVNLGNNEVEDVTLERIVIDENSELKGLSIRNSGIRERTNGLIVGIERNEKRILNPDSTALLEPRDTLWIVGERKKIQKLKEIDSKKREPGTTTLKNEVEKIK